MLQCGMLARKVLLYVYSYYCQTVDQKISPFSSISPLLLKPSEGVNNEKTSTNQLICGRYSYGRLDRRRTSLPSSWRYVGNCFSILGWPYGQRRACWGWRADR